LAERELEQAERHFLAPLAPLVFPKTDLPSHPAQQEHVGAEAFGAAPAPCMPEQRVEHSDCSLRPKKNDVLGFKICPKKNDILLNLACLHVHVDMQQSIST
jgi:hypothetical protein